MKEKDVISHEYLSDNERFADIINVVMFQGKPVLRGEDLSDEDVQASAFLGRLRKKIIVPKYRDLIKKATFCGNFIMIGIENQSELHHAMPVRVMGYGFMGYGEEPWTGPNSLSEIIDWTDIPDAIKEKVADYPLHVLDVGRFQESERLKTDARIVFVFLKRQKDEDELRKYVESNKEEFADIDEDAYDMITTMSNSKELMDKKEEYEKGNGGVDMCKALEDMREGARAEGREEAMEQMSELYRCLMEDERLEDMKRAIDDKQFCKKLFEEYHLD